jgi:uncharacterized protein DUF4038/collagenase-like protein with putative collagen-binding domain
MHAVSKEGSGFPVGARPAIILLFVSAGGVSTALRGEDGRPPAAGATALSRVRAAPAPQRAIGPLRVFSRNRRYFTDGSGKAVYLTGSHTWNNLQDSGPVGSKIVRFDFPAYLRFMGSRKHNFMRLWTYEVGENKSFYEPAPYSRTRSGKYDLNQFNPAYFDRLRSRVIQAREQGIYVSVMLFQGWSIYNHGYGNPWPLHPYHRSNNINGIDGDPDGDGEGREVHSLAVPAITRLQEAYVRKVIDTVNDLNNVLYEITNETAIYSRDWQYHMVRFIKADEASRPKRHPVGMTAFDSGRQGSTTALLAGPADWISPQNDGTGGDYAADPPAADGRKVMLTDTDHIFGTGGDEKWVWKSFARGLNPIFMDSIEDPRWEPARRAMGQTLKLAERIDLASMVPHSELASSAYCLADPGKEYLVYLPDGGEVTVDLTATTGTLAVEWMHPIEGTVTPAPTITGGARRGLTAPLSGDAVLHLYRPADSPKLPRGVLLKGC